jgi:hypothetical protein
LFADPLGRLTYGVNRRCRSGATGGDENSSVFVGEVAHRGNVRVERLVRCPATEAYN